MKASFFLKFFKKLRKSPFKRKKSKTCAAAVTLTTSEPSAAASLSRGSQTDSGSPDNDGPSPILQVDGYGKHTVKDVMIPMVPCRSLSSDDTSSLEDIGHRSVFSFRPQRLFSSFASWPRTNSTGPALSRKANRQSSLSNKNNDPNYTSHAPSPTPSDTSALCPTCLRLGLTQAWDTSSTGTGAKPSSNPMPPRRDTFIDADEKSPGLTEENEMLLARDKEEDEERLQELNRLRKHHEFLKQEQLYLQEAARTMLELLHRPAVTTTPRIEMPSADAQLRSGFINRQT